MRSVTCTLFLLLLFQSTFALAGQGAKPAEQGIYRVASPDGKIAATITVKGELTYAVTFQGKPLLLDSPFSLEFKEAPPFGKALVVREQARQSIHTAWENRFGKRRHIVDRCNELRLRLQEENAPAR